jgi:hypothetical protein
MLDFQVLAVRFERMAEAPFANSHRKWIASQTPSHLNTWLHTKNTIPCSHPDGPYSAWWWNLDSRHHLPVS